MSSAYLFMPRRNIVWKAQHSMSPKELERFINKTDKHRAEYYKYHTGREWTDARNYDLCLNSGKLGFDKCVDAIETQLKIMLGK